MDSRREVRAIWKHFQRYHFTIGEALIYYRFDADNSVYDAVYDEGFRQYHKGVRLPILWVDQMEATEDYAPEGRRPTQRLRTAVSAREMYEAGFSVTEAHGNRIQDLPPNSIWHRDRMHDVVWYDGRYYEISGFQIRGRVQGEDVIIGITGVETFPSDDMIFDYPPGTVPGIIPPPAGSFSIVTSPHPTGYSFTFAVTKGPGETVGWDFGDGRSQQAWSEETIDHAYPPGDYTVTAAIQAEAATTDVEASGSQAPSWVVTPTIVQVGMTAHVDTGQYIGIPTPDLTCVWWVYVPEEFGWRPQYDLFPALEIDATPFVGKTLSVVASIDSVVGHAAVNTPSVVIVLPSGSYGSGPYGSGPYGGTP